MSTMTVTTKSEEETIALGERLGRVLRAGDVVALHGELGAGKTRFVRGIARGMGLVDAPVNSPTYVLVNVYGPTARGGSLVHIDAYRLRGEEDLPVLGWDRLADGSNVIVIEWAERIGSALPGEKFDVTMEHVGEESRRVSAVTPEGRGMESASATCRTCGGAIPSGRSAFCSERCRMADLNRWFKGDYKISRPMNGRDLDEG
jgi:tRNA threonylcarbamoyladenosine biosynthesis protein TsaE